MVCIFEGQIGKTCYIIPGREIPKCFEKVNVCDTSVVPYLSTYKIIKKVKIQLPECDEWRGIVLCVLFLPTERHYRSSLGCQTSYSTYGQYRTWLNITSEYGKVESHHLWLHSVSKSNFRLPKTPGCSIDKKGFHQDQVELEIVTGGFLEVEKIGFRLI